jgi:PKD repeat protein
MSRRHGAVALLALFVLLLGTIGVSCNGDEGLEASFVAETMSGCCPLEVGFTGCCQGEVTGWAWDFDGDGQVDSDERNPTHTYWSPGAYTVSLTVTGPGGSDTETRVNCIEATPPNLPLVAGFTAQPASGTAPLQVHFTDDSEGVVGSWLWDFGDGGTSTLQNPSHTYDAAGQLTVTLTVTGPGGSDTETKVNYLEITSLGVSP